MQSCKRSLTWETGLLLLCANAGNYVQTVAKKLRCKLSADNSAIENSATIDAPPSHSEKASSATFMAFQAPDDQMYTPSEFKPSHLT
jgi:hypothetical protein